MSNEQTPPVAMIWLMTGDIPSGPFDPAQVHAKLEAGEVTWETRACPVGGAPWLPLLRPPGFGPTTPPPVPPAAPPASSAAWAADDIGPAKAPSTAWLPEPP